MLEKQEMQDKNICIRFALSLWNRMNLSLVSYFLISFAESIFVANNSE